MMTGVKLYFVSVFLCLSHIFYHSLNFFVNVKMPQWKNGLIVLFFFLAWLIVSHATNQNQFIE